MGSEDMCERYIAEVEDGLMRTHGQDPVIYAVEQLGEIGNIRAIPILKKALKHNNIFVHNGAAKSLFLLGDPTGLQVLLDDLKSYDDKKIRYAISALSSIRAKEAVEPLKEIKVSRGKDKLMYNGNEVCIKDIIDEHLHVIDPEQFGKPTEKSTYKKTKSGCFIATAVYNSYSAPEVMVLREFRDKVLQTNLVGKILIKAYYLLSPPIADFISTKESLKKLIRTLLLRPIVRRLGK